MLQFKHIIPHITSLYRQGLLVPFIGSGMSIGICTNWQEFISKLSKEVDIKHPDFPPEKGKTEPAVLYRLADRAVSSLKMMKDDERAKKLRQALNDHIIQSPNKFPIQTNVLSNIYWPLVLTTNYDDVYWAAANENNSKKHNKDSSKNKNESNSKLNLNILGRSLEDCHLVLRSLNENTDPILWTLQGFLGGQFKEVDEIIPELSRQKELLNQLVVGHQQYQRAINSENHFRRAFAEVYRRRSLFFIGSGLMEDYLINLFSEIIHHQGPGPYPHFALIKNPGNSEKKHNSNNAYDTTFYNGEWESPPFFTITMKRFPNSYNHSAMK